MEVENAKDINRVVGTELRSEFNENEAQILENAIIQKANGMFQWATLVTNSVVETYRETGQSLDALRDMIGRLPPDLHALYDSLLGTLQGSEKNQAIKLLNWILFAAEPLNLRQLRHALVVDANTTAGPVSEFSKSPLFVDVDRAVKTLSRGLAEVKTHGHSKTTQFIHQSVLDYLKAEGLAKLTGVGKRSEAFGYAHFQLSRSCIRYLMMEDLVNAVRDIEDDPDTAWKRLDEEFPLADYSRLFWVLHTIIAEIYGYDQQDLLEILPEGLTAFEYISLGGLEEVVLNVAKICLSSGKFDLKIKDERGETLLSKAVTYMPTEIVDILLTDGQADPNTRSACGWTPLMKSAFMGYRTTMQLLLSCADIEIEAQDCWGKTALYYAVIKSKMACANLILRHPKSDLLSSKVMLSSECFEAAKQGEEDFLVHLPDLRPSWLGQFLLSEIYTRAQNENQGRIIRRLEEAGFVPQEDAVMTGLDCGVLQEPFLDVPVFVYSRMDVTVCGMRIYHTSARAPAAPDSASIYNGSQIILVKADGSTFPNGDAWKCITCGVPEENAVGRSDTTDYPQTFRDGKRMLAGSNIIDCGDNHLNSTDCTPDKVHIYPIRWNVKADGSGASGLIRELRLHPDDAHLGFNSFSQTASGKLDQQTYFARLAFNPAPTTGTPLAPRYDLTNVTLLFNPNSPQPLTSNGTHLALNPAAITVGELRGFSGTGAEITYIGYPRESCNIDAFAVSLATGAIRRLTSHPEYTDPVAISPDDAWTVAMDTRGSGRQMFMAGMRHVPPLVDAVVAPAASSSRT
ncbi:hypothetical protein SLS54_009645 [Diplodia seriata]